MAQQVLDPRTSERRRLLQHLDVVLLGSTVCVALLGVVMVYSATQAKQQVIGVDPHKHTQPLLQSPGGKLLGVSD